MQFFSTGLATTPASRELNLGGEALVAHWAEVVRRKMWAEASQ